MGLHKHVSAAWKNPKEGIPSRYRIDRMAGWRKEPVFMRIDLSLIHISEPTRPY